MADATKPRAANKAAPASTPRSRAEKAAPASTPRSRAEKAARQARLAVEMRKNLAKRKRQQRARGAPGGPADR